LIDEEVIEEKRLFARVPKSGAVVGSSGGHNRTVEHRRSIEDFNEVRNGLFIQFSPSIGKED